MKNQKSVWVHIGCMINGTNEQIEKLLAGDGSELVAMIKNGQLELDNGPQAYLTDESISLYNEIYGTDIPTKAINIITQ